MAEEIANKLSLYQEQLRQVNERLESDASNQQFIKLKNDLQQLIKLTNELKEIAQPEAAEGSDDDSIDDDDLESAFNSSHSRANPLKIGDNVAVLTSETGARPFAGVLTSISPDRKHCTVKYFEYFQNDDVTLPLTHVVLLESLCPSTVTPEEITVGYKCKCKYSVDQLYYDAVVNSRVTGSKDTRGSSYHITYTEYNNEEIVPLEYIQPIITDANASSPSNNAKNANSTADQIIKIPESLKIKPTDTEEVNIYINICYYLFLLLFHI